MLHKSHHYNMALAPIKYYYGYPGGQHKHNNNILYIPTVTECRNRASQPVGRIKLIAWTHVRIYIYILYR